MDSYRPKPLYPLMTIRRFPEPELLRHPTIPRELWGLNPRSIWGVEWWDVVRRQAYAKYGHQCWACGKGKTVLEGHENYRFDYGAGIAEFLGVVALCHYCHSFIHSGMLGILARQKKISRSKKAAILKHGRQVLRISRNPTHYSGPMAPAKLWRLIVRTECGPVSIFASHLIR